MRNCKLPTAALTAALFMAAGYADAGPQSTPSGTPVTINHVLLISIDGMPWT